MVPIVTGRRAISLLVRVSSTSAVHLPATTFHHKSPGNALRWIMPGACSPPLALYKYTCISVYVYIYDIYTYTYFYIYIYIHFYMYIHIYIHVYTYIHVYVSLTSRNRFRAKKEHLERSYGLVPGRKGQDLASIFQKCREYSLDRGPLSWKSKLSEVEEGSRRFQPP